MNALPRRKKIGFNKEFVDGLTSLLFEEKIPKKAVITKEIEILAA